MGSVNFGIPGNHVSFLKNKMNLDLFVEGGTYTGGTAIRMSNVFSRVITIEKSPVMFEIAKGNIDNEAIKNIELRKGDTRSHLNEILCNYDNILFWLDAHWSGGNTYGEGDECPLLQELETILSFQKNYIILIDDARLFLAPPPLPHDSSEWPTIRNIMDVLPCEKDLLIHDDVIYVVPADFFEEFRTYLQYEITQIWKNKSHSKKSKKFPGLFSLFQRK